ncbi:uncharacterized protein LOC142181882 [Nicotiana tabacum]|uniref:Uncharacterized protein LOC142181882 n=1 Tax=Nicotiana tabacum TaxID=4097 RepID=A0AC58UQ47_TOBAC
MGLPSLDIGNDKYWLIKLRDIFINNCKLYMKWTTLLPYCIWELWKNRNHNNINNLDNYLDIRKVIHAAWEFTFSTERNPFVEKTINVEISWIKPNKDVIKLNYDGAFSSKSKRAGLGGAFRNSKGDWIMTNAPIEDPATEA